MTKKINILLLAVMMLFLVCQTAYADTYATYGDGCTTVSFYVESFGSAKLVFQQNPGECQEFTYNLLNILDGILGNCEEWGKYHIDITTPYGSCYREDWDKTYRGGNFEVKLDYAGIYSIQITPFTISEMTDSWSIDIFAGWTKQPNWWIYSQSNCNVYTSNPSPQNGSVTIYCYDQDGAYLDARSETITTSGYINPPSIPGYTSTSSKQYVTLDTHNGNCDPSYLDFYYKKNESSNSQSSVSSGQTIYPYNWDTQFKPALNSGLNSDQYRNLNNLSDDNRNTTFWWVIWKNERTDSYPEITAYFNNAEISSVGIRNGNPNNYYGYARAKRFRVEIYTNNGSYAGSTYIYLNDQNSSSYQIMSLGRTYYNVTQMDFYLDGGANEGFYEGSSERYYIHIADIQFYN